MLMIDGIEIQSFEWVHTVPSCKTAPAADELVILPVRN